MQTLELEEAMTSFQNEPEPAIPTEESPPPEVLRQKTLRLDDCNQVLLFALDCCGFQILPMFMNSFDMLHHPSRKISH